MVFLRMATQRSKPSSGVTKSRKTYATKAQTAHLQKWLNKNKHNPYPTRAEKDMLIIASGMNSKQVDDFFGNARRRMKKKNRSISHNNGQAANQQASLDNQAARRSQWQAHNHKTTNTNQIGLTVSLPFFYQLPTHSD